MLDSDAKLRIDTARDILVGKRSDLNGIVESSQLVINCYRLNDR
ncbi:hypothetical protein [Geotalea uraniireducens]|nr:hypothetical protein [Geotalea uraniireducens]